MSASRTLPPCNKDCEHCPFPDCVWDGLDYEDYKELAALDKDLAQTPEQKKLAARQRAYYEANREKIAAQKRAWYEANREKLAAQKRAWYEANREKLAAQKRAWCENKKRGNACAEKRLDHGCADCRGGAPAHRGHPVAGGARHARPGG